MGRTGAVVLGDDFAGSWDVEATGFFVAAVVVAGVFVTAGLTAVVFEGMGRAGTVVGAGTGAAVPLGDR